MAYYLDKDINGNSLPKFDKINALIEAGAEKLSDIPKVFIDGIICIIKNRSQDDAYYIHSELELQQWKSGSNAEKIWLKVDIETILKLVFNRYI